MFKSDEFKAVISCDDPLKKLFEVAQKEFLTKEFLIGKIGKKVFDMLASDSL